MWAEILVVSEILVNFSKILVNINNHKFCTTRAIVSFVCVITVNLTYQLRKNIVKNRPNQVFHEVLTKILVNFSKIHKIFLLGYKKCCFQKIRSNDFVNTLRN